jgi:hypothetical protein
MSNAGSPSKRPAPSNAMASGCIKKHPLACVEMARLLDAEGRQAVVNRNLKNGCTGEVHHGCFALGLRLLAGKHMDKDAALAEQYDAGNPAKAKKLRARACELGHEPACPD